MPEPSEAYWRALEEAQRHHAQSKTYSGRLLRPHKDFLSQLIEELGIKSALDYGCGKGEQYRWIDPADGQTLEQAWGFEVAKFDPAWPPYAAEPEGTFDLVICTHTLGSVPLVDHQWVIPRLIELADGAIYVAEKIGPIKKGVHGARDGMANGWTREQWIAHLKPYAATFPGPFIVSTVERIGEEKIMTRTAL